ncbi:MAG: TM2 domain-containing protein [Bacteroidota bacterium]
MEQERYQSPEDSDQYEERDFREVELELDREEGLYSQKSYTVAVILSAIFGVLGIQHFYLGRWGMGFFDLGLTVGGLAFLAADMPLLGALLLGLDGIHTIFVTYKLLVGEYRDGNGLIVPYPGQKKK